MPDPEATDPEQLRRVASLPELKSMRASTAESVGQQLRLAGQIAHLSGHIIGPGRIDGTSSRGNGDDALVGIGVLAQIAGDLTEAAGAHLSGRNHYAGAALLRQVVEVEYLTWAFANGKREAGAWLNSTREERQRAFTPSGLRKASEGHFLSADYAHHCEQGGHPVPRGIPLLGNADSMTAQMLLVDLLLHAWRTTDNLVAWSKMNGENILLRELEQIRELFSTWGRSDPLYVWARTRRGPA